MGFPPSSSPPCVLARHRANWSMLVFDFALNGLLDRHQRNDIRSMSCGNLINTRPDSSPFLYILRFCRCFPALNSSAMHLHQRSFHKCHYNLNAEYRNLRYHATLRPLLNGPWADVKRPFGLFARIFCFAPDRVDIMGEKQRCIQDFAESRPLTPWAASHRENSFRTHFESHIPHPTSDNPFESIDTRR